jgi:plasmid stabilization system protein ParE
MIISRQRLISLAGIAAGALLVYAMLTMAWLHHAHAAAEAAAPVPAAPGLDIATAVMLVVGVLVGVGVLLGGLSMVLRALQPLTQLTATTADDRALAGALAAVDGLHAKVDRLVDMLGGGRHPEPLPPLAAVPPRVPQGGFVRVGLLAVFVAGLCAYAAVTLVACAGAREKGTAGAEAFIDCMAPDVSAALPDLVPLAKSAVLKWISGDGHVDTAGIRADAVGIRGNLGKCALATAIAILSMPVARVAGAPAAAGIEVHSFELIAAYRSLDWAPVHTPNGVM